jgi:uncharacterized protein YjbI with pentapeptide repeats
MASKKQLAILQQGVNVWNAWRKVNPKIGVDLGGANLQGADLHEVDNPDMEESLRELVEQVNAGAPIDITAIGSGALIGLDLRRADLRGANFQGAHLRGANFQGADLRGANFQGAHLRPAHLDRANLQGANLSEADLSHADLYEANLDRANLHGAHLSEADLSHADLSHADLREADLHYAKLSHANLHGASLSEADLSHAHLDRANLQGAHLSEADLSHAHLDRANLQGADLREADLSHADLSHAHLFEADLHGANLIGANLSEAYLTDANLMESILIRTNLKQAKLNNCRIYGSSIWDVELAGAEQSGLIVTPDSKPNITVDNMKIAQFIYLLLHNEEIRDIIDTIGRKAVLILGRFTPTRKKVLDALNDELRNNYGYVSIMFDFQKPNSRSYRETIAILARLSRFVIADITSAKVILQELEVITPHLTSVPIQPILQKRVNETVVIAPDYSPYPWFLNTFCYQDICDAVANLSEKIITPAEAWITEQGSKR